MVLDEYVEPNIFQGTSGSLKKKNSRNLRSQVKSLVWKKLRRKEERKDVFHKLNEMLFLISEKSFHGLSIKLKSERYSSW